MKNQLMEIKLDLTRHCIETEIKKVHNRLIRQYFQSDSNKNTIELTIEVLKNFLEQVDFSSLRSDYPALAGSQAKVSLLIFNGPKVVIQLDNNQIPVVLT